MAGSEFEMVLGAVTQMGTGYFWDMLSMSQKYPVPIWVTALIWA